jgi:hypothetical protein
MNRKFLPFALALIISSQALAAPPEIASVIQSQNPLAKAM